MLDSDISDKAYHVSLGIKWYCQVVLCGLTVLHCWFLRLEPCVLQQGECSLQLQPCSFLCPHRLYDSADYC